MEVILPTSLTITMGAVAAFVTIIAMVVGIYFRLRGQLEGVQRQIDKRAQRNERADHETEAVKRGNGGRLAGIAGD